MNAQLGTRGEQRLERIRELLALGDEHSGAEEPRGSDGLIRDAERLTRESPALLECELTSVVDALRIAARLGLRLDRNEAAIVVVARGSSRTRPNAALVPSYQGLARLAGAVEGVRRVYAHVVTERDRFRWQLGLYPDVRHEPAESSAAANAARTHAYAVVVLENGQREFEVLAQSQIDDLYGKQWLRNQALTGISTDALAQSAALLQLCGGLPCPRDLMVAISLARNPRGSVRASENAKRELGVPDVSERSAPLISGDTRTTTDRLAVAIESRQARLVQRDRPLLCGTPVEEQTPQPTPPSPTSAVKSAGRRSDSPTPAGSSTGADAATATTSASPFDALRPDSSKRTGL